MTNEVALTVTLRNGRKPTYRVEALTANNTYLLHGARGACYVLIRRTDSTLVAMTRSGANPLEGVVFTDAEGKLAQKEAV